MTKKKSATKKVAPVEAESIEPEPAEELPVRQIEEVQDTAPESVEQPVEPEPVAETAPIVEPVAQEKQAEPEKSAEVVPQPVIEVVVEPAPIVDEHKTESMPTLPPKPKTLTLAYLQEEFGVMMEIIELHSTLITELQETQARKRKAPLSNGKIMIKDTLTGKVYPSKNATYQTLLKAGELKELVDKGILGDNPLKNSFGCYNLFRAYPNRFVEVKTEEKIIK